MAMIALHPLRTTQVDIGVLLLAVTTAVLVASSTPSLAITCDDVRGLTRAEQNYWSKQLNLTPDQRHRIWVECYSHTPSARVIEANGDGFQPLTNRDR
jgi:Spy/CpxP family protein refolding chaperone